MELDKETNTDSKTIRAINRDTVHKICSGQVVFNLAIAVKELVENAIDAGATNIEVRLKEYGSELVEVVDNGTGVEECNLAALTLKHYTSKLREFSDLESVATLGFRGEALSSLCALSNLSIISRHSSAEHAFKVDYDNNGHIKSNTPCSRQIGTTVTLTNLFSSLPVRHKEFIKNLKREFSKMCQLLYAYCLVAEGVRIVCTNQTNKGTRTTVVTTHGSSKVQENIVSVFGSKQLDSLVEIKLHDPDEQILEDYGIKWTIGDPLSFTFHGLISKCIHGSGRSTSDRQFYFINSRPCEPTKIMKLVNEVYRGFNGNQYPFIFLNIKAEQSEIDVNVTPDKRQIFMEKEKLLLATLKTTLLEMFKDFPSTFKMQNVEVNTKKTNEEISDVKKSVTEVLKQWSKINDKMLSSQKTRGVKRENDSKPKQNGIMNYIYEKRMKIDDDSKPELSDDSASEDEDKQLSKFVKDSYDSSDSEPDFTQVEKKLNILDKELRTSIKDYKKETKSFKITIENSKPKENSPVKEKSEEITIRCGKPVEKKPEIVVEKEIDKTIETNLVTDEEIDKSTTPENLSSTPKKTITDNISENSNNFINYSFASTTSQNVVVDANINDFRDIINKIQSCKIEETKSTVVKFRSELTSKDAEKELQKQISKDMFEKMSIIGQFNKGFIVTQLDSDIFLIDQHASDEKYNFETLQRTTVLQNQKLVTPKPLELTAANELILIENIEVFQKNGFAFNIDENAEPRKKVSLTAIPFSKNWEFGTEDIDELLFMLQEESSNDSCRPSRIRAMFASRACRKSVMIGSPLSVGDMRKLVDHMGEIEQPWNCPHGRPTMRHLINLDLIEQ